MAPRDKVARDRAAPRDKAETRRTMRQRDEVVRPGKAELQGKLVRLDKAALRGKAVPQDKAASIATRATKESQVRSTAIARPAATPTRRRRLPMPIWPTYPMT